MVRYRNSADFFFSSRNVGTCVSGPGGWQALARSSYLVCSYYPTVISKVASTHLRAELLTSRSWIARGNCFHNEPPASSDPRERQEWTNRKPQAVAFTRAGGPWEEIKTSNLKANQSRPEPRHSLYDLGFLILLFRSLKTIRESVQLTKYRFERFGLKNFISEVKIASQS